MFLSYFIDENFCHHGDRSSREKRFPQTSSPLLLGRCCGLHDTPKPADRVARRLAGSQLGRPTRHPTIAWIAGRHSTGAQAEHLTPHPARSPTGWNRLPRSAGEHPHRRRYSLMHDANIGHRILSHRGMVICKFLHIRSNQFGRSNPHL